MFGIDLFDASLAPALLIALLGGMLSFLSPCVLPIVPPYLAYMAGTTMEEATTARRPDRRVVAAALFFVLGLSTVFLFLGFAASAFGQVFLQYQREMSMVAGAVIILFGVHFLGLIRIPLLYREARFETRGGAGTALGAYVMGLAFAFGWVPCIGPVLGMILSLAAQESTLARGVLLMGVYALGLGLPFLLAAVFLNRAMGQMTRMHRHMGTIEKVMGGLLVVVGLALLSGWFSDFSWWLLETFPALGAIG
jgi:cytochrome c-type biogenesis protein